MLRYWRWPEYWIVQSQRWFWESLGHSINVIACGKVAPKSGFVELRYLVYQLVSTVSFMRLVRRPIFWAPVCLAARQSAEFIKVHGRRANGLKVRIQEGRVALLIEIIAGDVLRAIGIEFMNAA